MYLAFRRSQGGFSAPASATNTVNRLFKMAIRFGVTNAVQLYVANGVDVNATDDGGMSPIMYAADTGHAQICPSTSDSEKRSTSEKNPGTVVGLSGNETDKELEEMAQAICKKLGF